MQANELRIGNLVRLSESKKLTIYEVHEDCFYAKDIEGCSFKSTWADLQPIHLTEEILLKCGFEIEDGDKLVYHGDICDYIIEKTFEGYDIGVRHVSNTKYFSWDIYNLHQLQNLFHSIIGQELEISL